MDFFFETLIIAQHIQVLGGERARRKNGNEVHAVHQEEEEEEAVVILITTFERWKK